MLATIGTMLVITPAAAQGSEGEMFRRHFWRGQAYHGAGYPAQVGEMGRKPLRSAAPPASSMEALAEE